MLLDSEQAAIHRVTAPPSDQRNHTRFGVFYFAVPNDEEVSETLTESPVMQRAGYRKNTEPASSKVYCEARMLTTGKNKLHNKPIDKNGVAYDVFGGYVLQFNPCIGDNPFSYVQDNCAD